MAGLILIILGMLGILRAIMEYNLHKGPTKKLALTLAISFVFFGILGGIGALLTVINESAWAITAISVILGYLIIVSSVINVLSKLREKKSEEKPKEEKRALKLPIPHNILILNRNSALELLRALKEVPKLIITRIPPDEWPDVAYTEYIWLSRVEGPNSVSPTALHVIIERAKTFLDENSGGVIYVDGIEYIMLYEEFKSVAKFLLTLKDIAVVKEGHLILHVDPKTLEDHQMAVLEREFVKINVEETIEKIRGPTLFGALIEEKG
ncbi:MAG: hypothetical protein PWP39_1002 [Pyrococcus sp.]|uniref:DUF835 domain-containing protein n=1 Tax=Pyrococcus sp. TaxID=33866 RepID=UPI00258D79A0|nr:DUF835 domain-containing protein [Pyrococcus sp.]MDK2869767.1 hypothetical protein [Pyrococcus sp.]